MQVVFCSLGDCSKLVCSKTPGTALLTMGFKCFKRNFTWKSSDKEAKVFGALCVGYNLLCSFLVRYC